MKQKHVLGALLVLMLCKAVVETKAEGQGLAEGWWILLSALAFSFLCFFWYRLDSDERHYRRSMPLNAGVIALSPLVIPYYLVRSRPAGQKGRALLRLAGFILLMFVVSFIGVMMVVLFS